MTSHNQPCQSFTFALYHVAGEPEKYLEPIRQEAHEVLSKYGWTKAAMEKMYKADSLLKESQRFHGLGSRKSEKRHLHHSFTDQWLSSLRQPLASAHITLYVIQYR